MPNASLRLTTATISSVSYPLSARRARRIFCFPITDALVGNLQLGLELRKNPMDYPMRRIRRGLWCYTHLVNVLTPVVLGHHAFFHSPCRMEMAS